MTQLQSRPVITDDHDSIPLASALIVVLAILLGWIPLIGPAVAGYFGGRKAGSAGRGLIAGLIPAVLLAVVVGLALAAFELPVIGAVTGAAVFIWAAVEAVPLLIFAAIGGAIDESQTGPPS